MGRKRSNVFVIQHSQSRVRGTGVGRPSGYYYQVVRGSPTWGTAIWFRCLWFRCLWFRCLWFRCLWCRCLRWRRLCVARHRAVCDALFVNGEHLVPVGCRARRRQGHGPDVRCRRYGRLPQTRGRSLPRPAAPTPTRKHTPPVRRYWCVPTVQQAAGCIWNHPYKKTSVAKYVRHLCSRALSVNIALACVPAGARAGV